MASNGGQGNGPFVFGLILGAIGGAVAALFMTPKSGETLRKDIGSTFNETAGPVVAQGKERATGFIDKAANRAQEVSGKIAAMDLPFQGNGEVEQTAGPATAASNGGSNTAP